MTGKVTSLLRTGVGPVWSFSIEKVSAAALPLPAASVATSAGRSTVTGPSAIGLIDSVYSLSPSAPSNWAMMALVTTKSLLASPVTGSSNVTETEKGPETGVVCTEDRATLGAVTSLASV